MVTSSDSGESKKSASKEPAMAKKAEPKSATKTSAAAEKPGEMVQEFPAKISNKRRWMAWVASGVFVALLAAVAAGFIGSFLYAYLSSDQELVAEVQAEMLQTGDRIDQLRADIETVAGDSVSQEQLQSILTVRDSELAERFEEIRMAIIRFEEEKAVAETASEENDREKLPDTVSVPVRSEMPKTLEPVTPQDTDAGRRALALMAIAAARAVAEFGVPYIAILEEADIGDEEVPDLIWQQAQSGLPTMADLKREFAFSAERAVATASKGGLLGSIIQIRPLEPQEGNDPISIISRAQVAVDAAQLDQAAEILAQLDRQAHANFDEWLQAVRVRIRTLAAFDAVMAQGLSR